MRPVDPKSYLPKHVQAAMILREVLASGKYQPGQKLPAVGYLAGELRTSIPTVRRALNTLAVERLIHTEKGMRAVVVGARERDVVHVSGGDRIRYQVANPDERQALDLAEGEWVAIATRSSGEVERFVASEVEFVVTDAGEE